jgi:hypothetical protein
MNDNVVKIFGRSSITETSELAVIARLKEWRAVMGNPMGPGRANPDNDLFYLFKDAEDVIVGLRTYAKKLEESLDRLNERAR